MPSAFTWFIAHASVDAAWALDLFHALSPEPTFLDLTTLRTGEIWGSTLVEAQANSRATVVLVSSAAPNAYYLGEEISRAIDLMRREGRRVLPVYLDGLPKRSQDVPYGLYSLQGLDGRALGAAGVAAKLNTHLAGLPTTPIGAVATPPRATRKQLCAAAIATRNPRVELIADLDLEAPMAELRRGTLAEFALDLVNWAWAQGDPTLRQLEDALRGTAPVAFR